jgi:hypothetical protein
MIHDKGVVGNCGHEGLLFVNSRHVGKVPQRWSALAVVICRYTMVLSASNAQQ